jgi:hypothetical protein
VNRGPDFNITPGKGCFKFKSAYVSRIKRGSYGVASPSPSCNLYPPASKPYGLEAEPEAVGFILLTEFLNFSSLQTFPAIFQGEIVISDLTQRTMISTLD